MHWQRDNPSRTVNNHGNMVSQKENNNFPGTKLKVTKDCYLNDRKFKIAVMKKLSEIQEKSERQFMSSRVKLMNVNTLPKKRTKQKFWT